MVHHPSVAMSLTQPLLAVSNKPHSFLLPFLMPNTGPGVLTQLLDLGPELCSHRFLSRPLLGRSGSSSSSNGGLGLFSNRFLGVIAALVLLFLVLAYDTLGLAHLALYVITGLVRLAPLQVCLVHLLLGWVVVAGLGGDGEVRPIALAIGAE